MSQSNMDVTNRLIDEIQKAVPTEIIAVDGQDFTTRPIHEPPRPAMASALTIHTLQGIVDYLKSDAQIDRILPTENTQPGMAVHVVNESNVRIIREVTARQRDREIMVEAQSVKVVGTTFAFGRYLNLEDFIIALKTLFDHTGDVDQIIQIVGRVEDSKVTEFADDGLSQQVTTRVGAATRANVPVPTLVTLRPFRTFREIEQPEGQFLLRLTSGADEDEPPQAALFETDGGAWKLEAITKTRDFLRLSLPESIPIIA